MADAVLTRPDAQPSFSSVGLIGFSQGGAMALRTPSDRLRAAAPFR
ncbi:hypothetical protein [Streptomyces liangshanensis]